MADSKTWGDIAEHVVGDIAWPSTVWLVIWLTRKQLGGILTDLGRRLRKANIPGGGSLEFDLDQQQEQLAGSGPAPLPPEEAAATQEKPSMDSATYAVRSGFHDTDASSFQSPVAMIRWVHETLKLAARNRMRLTETEPLVDTARALGLSEELWDVAQTLEATYRHAKVRPNQANWSSAIAYTHLAARFDDAVILNASKRLHGEHQRPR